MVALSNVQFGRRNEDIRIVQRALIRQGRKLPGGVTGLFDDSMKSAYAAEQRSQGFRGKDADGIPGETSLARLGRLQGFGVKEAAAGGATRGRVSSPVPGRRVTHPFFAKGPYAWKRVGGVGRHTGEDYAAPMGVPVVAVRGGTVAWSNSGGGAYGQWIGLKADNGHIYTYNHLSKRQVRTGQKVKAGQQLGKVGSTGNSTGPHLHFEMSKGGSWAYGSVAKPKW